jgi:outer membrane immunogenic protein
MSHRKSVLTLGAGLAAGLTITLATMGAAQAQGAFGDGNGFYLGGGLGNAHANVHTNATANSSAASYFITTDFGQVSGAGEATVARNNFSGTAFGGYEQRYGNLLAGVEASAHGMSLDESRSQTVTWLSAAPSQFTLRQSYKADWQATLRGRLGLACNSGLAYVTAGAAFTRATYAVNLSDNFGAGMRGSASSAKTLTGWTAGVGGEYALNRHLALRAEYLYADFGSVHTTVSISSPSSPGLGNTVDSSARLKTQLATVGLVYRF